MASTYKWSAHHAGGRDTGRSKTGRATASVRLSRTRMEGIDDTPRNLCTARVFNCGHTPIARALCDEETNTPPGFNARASSLRHLARPASLRM